MPEHPLPPNWAAFTDCDGLLMNQVEVIAMELGAADAYSGAHSRMCYDEMRKYARLLGGRKLDEVSGWLAKARPYPGAEDAIRALKQAGYKVHVISDNALLTLPEAYEAVSRLGIEPENIHQTTELDIDGDHFTGNLNGHISKAEIAMNIIEKTRPTKLVAIGHEMNDRDFLELVKDFDGTRVVIGTVIEEADLRAKDLMDFPKVIPQLR